jgi:hypothetical protein
MAHLHKELNYTTSRIALRRMFIFAIIWLTIGFMSSEPASDWRNSFDQKYARKVYGALEEGVNEGGGDDD